MGKTQDKKKIEFAGIETGAINLFPTKGSKGNSERLLMKSLGTEWNPWNEEIEYFMCRLWHEEKGQPEFLRNPIWFEAYEIEKWNPLLTILESTPPRVPSSGLFYSKQREKKWLRKPLKERDLWVWVKSIFYLTVAFVVWYLITSWKVTLAKNTHSRGINEPFVKSNYKRCDKKAGKQSNCTNCRALDVNSY